jgi:hypothetical protein
MTTSGQLATLTSVGVSTPTRAAAEERRLWIAFAVLGVGLYANQYLTLRKLKALLLTRAPGDPVATLADKAWALLLDSWRVLLTPADVAVTATVLAAIGYVVWAEVRKGACSALLERADRSRHVLFGFLALASLIITRGYLTPGQVFMGDSETQMLRSWMYAEHFRNLEMPVWSNAWYGGFPLLANYSPLYFIATAVLTLAFGDIHVATKLLLWACHVGSVFAMFFFLREALRRNLPALLGALAYALTFHRLHIILYQGDVQIAVVFLLYPIMLLVAERFIRTRQGARATFVALTLLEAALLLNHHGYAFFGLVFLGLYLTARLAATQGAVWERLKLLAFFGATQVAALAISAFLIVPVLFENGEYRGLNGDSPFGILIPNPWGPIMLIKLLRWSAFGDGGTLGYIGLSIGIFAAVGAWHAARRRDAPAIGLIAGAVASLLMVRQHGQYNVRNVDFFMVFVAALSAWALCALEDPATRFAVVRRAQSRWRDGFAARAAVVLAALLLIDLGPTTFQSVYRENYGFKQPMYEKLAGLSGPYKVIERQVLTYEEGQAPGASFDPRKLGIPSAYAPTQTPLGFFHEGAGLSYGYRVEMVKQLHRDLNAGRVSETSVAGLYLMGVKHVIFRDRYRWFTPPLPASPLYSVRDAILETSHATPLLASTRVIGLADVAGYPGTDIIRERRYLDPETFDYKGVMFDQLVLPLIQRMNPDMDRGVADVLISRDGDLRVDLGSPEALRIDIVDFATDLKRVAVRYRSNLDAVGRLPFNYFPYLQVEVDGRPVPFHRSAMNDILLRIPAGEHLVTVLGVAPPLQRAMFWVSLAALLAVVIAPRRSFIGLERRPSRD